MSKKITSLLLTFTLIMSSVVAFPITGYAHSVGTSNLYTYVDNASKSAATYYLRQSGVSSFNTSNASDFLTLLESGVDMSAYYNDFLQDVELNLMSNGGKLMTSYSSESVLLYGAVINSLLYMGESVTNFKGFDIVSAFDNMDTEGKTDSPYECRVAVKAAKNVALDSKAKDIISSMINSKYTIGSGLNYWGYSCDNTSMFIAAVSNYSADFNSYIDDALSLLPGYKTDNGYFYDSQYGTEASCDSTAMALTALSYAGQQDSAQIAFGELMQYTSGDGGYKFQLQDSPNSISTLNALIGLNAYKNYVSEQNITDHSHIWGDLIADSLASCTSEGISHRVCLICGERENFVSPSIAHNFQNGVCTMCGASQYPIVTPTAPQPVTTAPVTLKRSSISKLTPGKKLIKVKWKKTSNVTGYIIELSTSKKFTKKTTKKYVVRKKSATSYTVKKLKAKKKYYVRVRSYKKTDSGKIYSKWSTVKSVKTK